MLQQVDLSRLFLPPLPPPYHLFHFSLSWAGSYCIPVLADAICNVQQILQGVVKVVRWKSPVLTVCILNKIPKSVSLCWSCSDCLIGRDQINLFLIIKTWTKLIFLLLLVVKRERISVILVWCRKGHSSWYDLIKLKKYRERKSIV